MSLGGHVRWYSWENCLHEIGKREVRENLGDLRVDGVLVGYNWFTCNYVTKSNEIRCFFMPYYLSSVQILK